MTLKKNDVYFWACTPNFEELWLKHNMGVPFMAQQLINLTGIHKHVGSIPGLLSVLRIWRCRELWCRSQMWLRSCIAVAVAVAGSCSLDLTPSLGTSICCRWNPKKQRKKGRKKERERKKGKKEKKCNADECWALRKENTQTHRENFVFNFSCPALKYVLFHHS